VRRKERFGGDPHVAWTRTAAEDFSIDRMSSLLDREEETDAQDASSGGTDRQHFVFCHACSDDTWPDERAAAADRSAAHQYPTS